jgi:hypothetical protein
MRFSPIHSTTSKQNIQITIISKRHERYKTIQIVLPPSFLILNHIPSRIKMHRSCFQTRQSWEFKCVLIISENSLTSTLNLIKGEHKSANQLNTNSYSSLRLMFASMMHRANNKRQAFLSGAMVKITTQSAPRVPSRQTLLRVLYGDRSRNNSTAHASAPLFLMRIQRPINIYKLSVHAHDFTACWCSKF